MSKLTKLELENLRRIKRVLDEMLKSYEDNVDSVQDFIHKQLKIDTDEPNVLKSASEFFSCATNNIEGVSEGFNLLIDHFEQSSK